VARKYQLGGQFGERKARNDVGDVLFVGCATREIAWGLVI
jgi:hypothetical protein